MENTTEKSKMGRRIWEFFDDAKLFFQEARNRWKATTPKFIRVAGNICAAISGLGAIPTMFTQMGVIVPPVWLERFALVVMVAGGVGKLIAQFPFSPGQHVELPYTEKKQEQAAEKQNG